MACLWAASMALCVHAQAHADGGAVQRTLAADSGTPALESFVQCFLIGFIGLLLLQAVGALRRLRSDFKAVRRG